MDGAGVRLVRVLGPATVLDFDPFLMLDAFDSTDPRDYLAGFPWHPHRGIETVTFLAAGRIDHGDSLGNEGSIESGDCQWMTAGRGIIHQEMPQSSPRLLGLQLWLNLPAKDKMRASAYRDIRAATVPTLTFSGGAIRAIAGTMEASSAFSASSPTDAVSLPQTAGAARGDSIDMLMLDVSLEPGWILDIPIATDLTAFAYPMIGDMAFGSGKALGPKRAVLLGNGERLLIKADAEKASRCVIFAARPLHEPVAWGGPIVMNTDEELDLAFRELDEGTFIKK